MDPLTGEILPKGKVEEVVVHSPWLTREYYRDPAKTEELWKYGWLIRRLRLHR